MSLGIYTRIVLTVFAIALWGLLLKPIFISGNVGASSQVLDVNLKEIGGRLISDKILDVNVERINGRTFYNALPVEIKK